MDTATAEALGREAVALGWPWRVGQLDTAGYTVESCGPGGEYFDARGRTMSGRMPFFGHEPTALACIPWVRSVYEEKMGPGASDLEITWEASGVVTVMLVDEHVAPYFKGPTLAHACIAAVRAAQGGA